MKVTLQINSRTTQFEQMARQFGLSPTGNTLHIPPAMGEGFIRYFEMPYQIQCHHYRYKLNSKIEVSGINHQEDGLYMLNINLSNRILRKNIGESPRQLSREGKSGVVFYAPGYHSNGSNEIDQEFEIVFFAFPRQTLENKLTSPGILELSKQPQFCMYAELPDQIDQQLRAGLEVTPDSHPFLTEGKLLAALGAILELFANRKYLPSAGLNIQDVERQFKVKEILMAHIYGNLPTIDVIADQVHTSQSKLKSDFKSIFGNSIYQYYLSKKMETAKALLTNQEGTIAEIGYRLGYSNIAQFSARFKKHFGVSPSKMS